MAFFSPTQKVYFVNKKIILSKINMLQDLLFDLKRKIVKI